MDLFFITDTRFDILETFSFSARLSASLFVLFSLFFKTFKVLLIAQNTKEKVKKIWICNWQNFYVSQVLSEFSNSLQPSLVVTKEKNNEINVIDLYKMSMQYM